MNLPHGYHTVAWYEQFKHRDFVFMRRGTGETGWWHQHEGEADYGGNPMDYKRTMSAYECRTCGATLSQDAATKARASSGDSNAGA
jgi:hypothetical protein